MHINDDYSVIIKNIWNQNTENPNVPFEKDLILLKLKKYLDVISIGEYFFYIVNLYSGEIEFVSNQIKDILRYNVNEFNLDLYLKIIHPEDLPYLIEIQKKVSDFTINNSDSERIQYKFCYDFRIKHKAGDYIQLYIQHFYLGLSENYNPQRAFSLLTNISHIKIGGTPKLNIFRLGKGVVNILNEKEISKIQLTAKQNEIFELLIKGFTSQDIGDALGISKHTVDTHRRNILKRNECSNTSELLNLYFGENLEGI